MGFHNFEVRDGLKWGILLFILREVLFFSAWFWAFFHNSLNPGRDLGSIWPPFNILTLEPFQVPLLNTCVLLLRGIIVTWSHHNLINDEDAVLSLIFTVILGFIFTSLQALEYIESFFCLRENCYSSRFFVTTGFHGVHVIIGTIFLFYCLIFLNFKNLRKWQHVGIEFAIWYWHFVDVVWLFLFFFIYWWSFYKVIITFKVIFNLYKVLNTKYIKFSI
jgi:heme/copper-type cytochrome/quinol oxidase subunit 3